VASAAVRPRSGSHRGQKDEMAKGHKKSDGRKVPQGRRKAARSAGRRGGKSATASKRAGQLGLFCETADSPKGEDAGAGVDRSTPATGAVPKSQNTRRGVLPAMTMEEVASYGNLKRAFESVEANKGAPGPDGKSIEEVKEHLDEILPALQGQLLDGTYRPGMIRRVWIAKSGGGQRGLGIPDVVDRWVQQAVYQVLSPHYEPTFHPSSHGFRPGRSCQTAIEQAKGYLEEGYEGVGDFDLEKFFDRVHHDRLLSRLEQRVSDRRLIGLIRRMLKAKVAMPDGVVVSTEEGTPQGGPLSPLLSNIVLDELDWELDRRGHRFVRYADDSNIYVRSERAGKRVMGSICRFIEKRLRLKVNMAKSAVARPEERHFVGFRLRRDSLDGHVEVLLSKRSKERIDAKIVELTPRTWGQSLRSCIRRINAYLLGWIGFFRVCTEAEAQTLHALDAHIRRRLRAIQLRHWKRKRTMAKRLIKLGVKPQTAWRNLYKGRRSWWALSHCSPVDQGLRNAYLAERGLVSLEVEWERYHPRTINIAPKQLELQWG
jgi:RNA-directed DNA polymerase